MKFEFKNIEEISDIIDRYESIVDRADKIVRKYGCSLKYYFDVEHIEMSRDLQSLIVTGTDYDGEYHDGALPASWLFISDEELKVAVDEEVERRRQIKLEIQAHLKKKRQEEFEKQERAEYERLKLKFEGTNS